MTEWNKEMQKVTCGARLRYGGLADEFFIFTTDEQLPLDKQSPITTERPESFENDLKS
jgi:hypothetical protein